MARIRSSDGILIVVLLAALGVLLVYVPNKVIELYDRVKGLGAPYIYFYWAMVGTGGAILLLLGGTILYQLWKATRDKNRRRDRTSKNPSELSLSDQEREVADNLAAVQSLQDGTSLSDRLRQQLQALVARVEQKQAAQRLEIVAFGTISSGKSSLLNALAGQDTFQTDPRGGTTTQRLEVPWAGNDQVVLVDTPGLGEIDAPDHVALAAQAARDADLVLLVVDGPLRDSEHQLLTKLGAMEKRVLICLNKADWFSETEQAALIGQIEGQVSDLVAREDILPVRSQPTMRPRVRVLAGAGEQEEMVPVPADTSALARRMLDIIRADGRELLVANLLLRSRGLIEDARRLVEEAIDQQARDIVNRYTWACAAAAALSPLPLLDLFTSSALTVKMVIDLARVYRQPLDFDIAVNLLGQLGKNLIAILGVNAAAPAVASALASLIKTIPIAGTVAGGALQGIVQGLVTRWIGLVFIAYFKADMKMPPEGLANLARREWQRLTSPTELVNFLHEARQKLQGR